MTIEVRPARSFADVRTMVGPKNPDANVCWCLSHRLESKVHTQLSGRERGETMRKLVRRAVAPGVLAYDVGDDGTDEVVGWAAVAPRADLPVARSRKIGWVDDQPVWSVFCIKVRPGHRKKGIAAHLLRGAAAYAFEQGAPVVEGYPVDNRGEKVDLTMAFVGLRHVFEAEGFTLASTTDAVAGGFPRVLMRISREEWESR